MTKQSFPQSKSHLPFEVVVASRFCKDASAILSQCIQELKVIGGQYQQLDYDLFGFELQEDCRKFARYLNHFGIDYEADV